ncbi:peptidylprolyl isomerase [Paenibacillus yanchengensis]|uniref:Peptidylprolyl isomerase n=1 Tax=Paenibacillus yanchengensis TaxID=2035833 RepID=A0ABW4YIN2_9BACL
MYQVNNKKWRKSTLLVLTAVLTMALLAGCGKVKKEDYSLQFKDVDKGDVVATYEGGQVTKDEFDKFLALQTLQNPEAAMLLQIPQYQEMIMQQYITFKVLTAQASEETIAKARDLTHEEMTNFKKFKKENKDFQKTMKDSNITENDMATLLMLTTTMSTHLNSKVTDEDVNKAYKDLSPNFATTSARHILVKTTEQDPETGAPKEVRPQEEALKMINEIKEKLQANEDWDALAKQYSEDPGSKETGGLYENTDASDWDPAFKQAAFDQEIGVIGEPVLSSMGYHIIKVEKREVKALDQLTEEQRAAVDNTASYSYLEKFMAEEVEKLNIEINLPQPEPSPSDAPAEGAGEGNKEAEPDAEQPAETDNEAEKAETPAAK